MQNEKLRFKFKNLGAVKSGEVQLNNLTIICGKNNSGKSYISYVIYSFLKEWFKYCYRIKSLSKSRDLISTGSISVDLNKEIKTFYEDLTFGVKNFSKNLDRVLNVEKGTFDKFSLEVFFNNQEIEEELLKHEIFSEFNIAGSTFLTSKVKEESILTINQIQDSESEVAAQDFNAMSLGITIDRIIYSLFGELIFPRVFSIPSERSGVSLFSKELDINRNYVLDEIMSTRVSNKKNLDTFLKGKVSRYPLPIKDNIDFFRDLEQIKKNKSFLKNDKLFLRQFESFIGGRFYPDGDNVRFTNSSRKDKKFDIPIHIGSSFLKSMSHLYFYCFHVAKPGDVLIIDEPELNLHADNQILLARILALLINKNISVFVTTHSDFIINEFVLLAKISRFPASIEKFNRLGITEQLIIKAKELSLYLVDEGNIRNLTKDNEGGNIEIGSISDAINKQTEAYSILDLISDEDLV